MRKARAEFPEAIHRPKPHEHGIRMFMVREDGAPQGTWRTVPTAEQAHEQYEREIAEFRDLLRGRRPGSPEYFANGVSFELIQFGQVVTQISLKPDADD
jgi:hypothetical protein